MIDPRQLIEQLLIVRTTQLEVVARSEGITPELEESVLQLIAKTGDRPWATLGIPELIFACPLNPERVAVGIATGIAGSSYYRVLLLQRIAYEAWPDPFRLSRYFPAEWSVRGDLPLLTWSASITQPREVGQLQEFLKTGDSALLLGATQALVDGGKLLLALPDGRPEQVEQIWSLLPDSTRSEIAVTNAASDPTLGCELSLVACAPDPWPVGYLSAEQARDYPEGRYELSLQTAIESNDQAELYRLLARRSSRQSLRLALTILALMIGLTLIVKWIL